MATPPTTLQAEQDYHAQDLYKRLSYAPPMFRWLWILSTVCTVIVLIASAQHVYCILKVARTVKRAERSVFLPVLACVYLKIFLFFPLVSLFTWTSFFSIGFALMLQLLLQLYEVGCLLWFWDLMMDFLNGPEEACLVLSLSTSLTPSAITQLSIATNPAVPEAVGHSDQEQLLFALGTPAPIALMTEQLDPNSDLPTRASFRSCQPFDTDISPRKKNRAFHSKTTGDPLQSTPTGVSTRVVEPRAVQQGETDLELRAVQQEETNLEPRAVQQEDTDVETRENVKPRENVEPGETNVEPPPCALSDQKSSAQFSTLTKCICAVSPRKEGEPVIVKEQIKIITSQPLPTRTKSAAIEREEDDDSARVNCRGQENDPPSIDGHPTQSTPQPERQVLSPYLRQDFVGSCEQKVSSLMLLPSSAATLLTTTTALSKSPASETPSLRHRLETRPKKKGCTHQFQPINSNPLVMKFSSVNDCHGDDNEEGDDHRDDNDERSVATLKGEHGRQLTSHTCCYKERDISEWSNYLQHLKLGPYRVLAIWPFCLVSYVNRRPFTGNDMLLSYALVAQYGVFAVLAVLSRAISYFTLTFQVISLCSLMIAMYGLLVLYRATSRIVPREECQLEWKFVALKLAVFMIKCSEFLVRLSPVLKHPEKSVISHAWVDVLTNLCALPLTVLSVMAYSPHDVTRRYSQTHVCRSEMLITLLSHLPRLALSSSSSSCFSSSSSSSLSSSSSSSGRTLVCRSSHEKDRQRKSAVVCRTVDEVSLCVRACTPTHA